MGGTRLQQAIELRAHGDFATVLGGLTETETAFSGRQRCRNGRRKAQEEQIRQEQLATAKAALRAEQSISGSVGPDDGGCSGHHDRAVPEGQKPSRSVPS